MLIKVIFIVTAAIGAATVIVIREKEPAKTAPPAVLRQPTPAERQLLNSMTTAAPKPLGGMH